MAFLMGVLRAAVSVASKAAKSAKPAEVAKSGAVVEKNAAPTAHVAEKTAVAEKTPLGGEKTSVGDLKTASTYEHEMAKGDAYAMRLDDHHFVVAKEPPYPMPGGETFHIPPASPGEVPAAAHMPAGEMNLAVPAPFKPPTVPGEAAAAEAKPAAEAPNAPAEKKGYSKMAILNTVGTVGSLATIPLMLGPQLKSMFGGGESAGVPAEPTASTTQAPDGYGSYGSYSVPPETASAYLPGGSPAPAMPSMMSSPSMPSMLSGPETPMGNMASLG